MKPSFIFFIVVLVLGFIAGFYYHEALNEKVQYERDSCYSFVQNNNLQNGRTFQNINNISDVVIYGTEK